MTKQEKRGIPFILACVAVALLAGGCNSGPDTTPVEGKVLLDGEPLKFGSVMFQNTSGGQPATGEIQPDGSFNLSTYAPEDGATLGEHRVRITCYSLQDPSKRAAAGPMGDSLGQLLIPQQYTSLGASRLRATVVAGQSEPIILELESKPNRRR